MLIENFPRKIYFLFFLSFIFSSCNLKRVDCSLLNKEGDLTFIQGQKYSGECYSYFDSGKIRSKQQYKDGLDHGEWIFYFEDEKVQTKGTFLNGKRINKWLYFYENGNLKQESFYDSLGNRIGDWKIYDPDGKLDWVRRF